MKRLDFVLAIMTFLLALPASAQPASAASAASAPACSRGWAYSQDKGRCIKDQAYWNAKRGEKPCRAQVWRYWGSCVADNPNVPGLKHGERYTLVDSTGTTRAGTVGRLTLQCQRGLLKPVSKSCDRLIQGN
jgi:hypothetical protein